MTTLAHILQAIRTGDVLYLQEHFSFIEQAEKDYHGRLHDLFVEACQTGQIPVIEYLLPLCDPKENESMALFWAVMGNSDQAFETVRLLIPMSNPKAKQSRALNCAASKKRYDILELLLPHSDISDGVALLLACEAGCLRSVKRLCECVDPKIHDSHPLRKAVAAGHVDIVKFLLPLSDLKAKNSLALVLASQKNHQNIFDLLYPVSDPKAALESMTNDKKYKHEQKKMLIERFRVDHSKQKINEHLEKTVSGLDPNRKSRKARL